MLTNKDLNIINNIIEYLFATSKNYKDDVALDLALDLTKIANKVYKNKKIYSNKSNEYNKKNKLYHKLINQKSYYKKRNNQAKVKEIEEKMKLLKENSTI